SPIDNAPSAHPSAGPGYDTPRKALRPTPIHSLDRQIPWTAVGTPSDSHARTAPARRETAGSSVPIAASLNRGAADPLSYPQQIAPDRRRQGEHSPPAAGGPLPDESRRGDRPGSGAARWSISPASRSGGGRPQSEETRCCGAWLACTLRLES